MRILALYNDPIHAWPLLRSREALRAMGIGLDAREERVAERFGRHCASGWDCILIHQELMSEEVVDCGRPVAILERIDGAQLGTARRWIADVTGVFKGYCLRPAMLNNEFRGRVHAHALRAAGVRGKLVDGREATCAQSGKPPQIQPKDLAKIQPFFGFGAYKKQADVLAHEPDLVAPRKTSVLFAGTVSYSVTEVETHRRLAARLCRSIRGGIGLAGRPMRPEQYYGAVADARAVLSPWGWGESCHRDYEAWILGAVLIKPECDWVAGWPDVYRANETYLPCRHDLGDVPAIVSRVHREWRDLEPMRRHCRALAEEAASPEAIAKRLKHLLEIIL